MITFVSIIFIYLIFFVFYTRYERDKLNFNKGQCKRCGCNLELFGMSFKKIFYCIDKIFYHYKCPNCKKIITTPNEYIVNEYEFRKNNPK